MPSCFTNSSHHNEFLWERKAIVPPDGGGYFKFVLLLLMYSIAQLFIGLTTLFIRRRSVEASHIIQTYAAQIQDNINRFIWVVAFGLWVYLSAKIYGIAGTAGKWMAGIMGHQWQFGSIAISLQSIFNFFLILVITWLFGRAVNILLNLEVFPRIKLPRGVPTTISTVIRYTIFGFGLLLALSSLGLDISQLGIMAGALGIGLGFGLRNIIANFISGIIMVFERPVQIGDVIEIDNTFGKIQKIGVRSSSVETFDGSEVIVPNVRLFFI
ncbi:MAG: hypothetical protein DRH12_07885 [Deltaproteobacteria bacterium]|nr:MAG: hypothetical protein DRH12_07885 [Deltaproteobacteria bacterium]